MTKGRDTIFPQPFYYIGFSIRKDDETESQFQSLFSNEKGSLQHFLEHEAYSLRQAGWNLPQGEQYTIQLDGLEYRDATRRIKILENGHIIIQAAVSEEYLCWANSSSQSTLKGKRVQINTTALIEFTYNSIVLLQRALVDAEAPAQIICDFGFIGVDANYVLGNVKLPSPNEFSFSSRMNPIGKSTESNINIALRDVSDEGGVARVSYSILKLIFRMFSFSENAISYVHADGDKIDPESIKRIQ